MPKYKSKVTGLKAVQKELAKLGDDAIAAAKDGLTESAEYVDTSATKKVHRATGAAAAGIEVKYSNDGLTAQIGWFDEQFYYMIWQELGSKNRKANPALTNAGVRGARKFLKLVSEKVTKAVE